MKRLALAAAIFAMNLGAHAAAYGSLNNFDVVNDTGGKCYGFEIELDDLHSTDITYTYDYNHYGVPKITEDKTDPAHPKTFVRYEAKKNPDGSYASFTNPQDPANPLGPTGGHAFTNPGVNLGGEHFGVGFLRAPTVALYHWLVDDRLSPGTLALGPAVNVATPTFVYVPPVFVPNPIPAQPPIQVAPAQAQVVIVPPAPEVPEPELHFGVPVWVKVLKTVQPSGHKMELNELLPNDEVANPNGVPPWQGEIEAPETEIEWQVFQKRPAGDPGGDGAVEAADNLPNGDETVTRRYEFYVYEVYTGLAGYDDSVDPDTGEAQFDDPTKPGAEKSLGHFIGAQMAGFNVESPLGLVDHLQDEDVFVPYVDRAVVSGGKEPYSVKVTTGTLPDGLVLAPLTGVLSGTPTLKGAFTFTITASDADAVIVTKQYTLTINGPVVLNGSVTITRGGFRLNRATGRFAQAVKVKNTSAVAHAGPVSLILDSLSANASLYNATGATALFAPPGSPFVDLNVGADGTLSPGETATVTLEFVNPTKAGITYSTRVLAGPGSR